MKGGNKYISKPACLPNDQDYLILSDWSDPVSMIDVDRICKRSSPYKTGPSEYKKNYVYLNGYTMYAVEDITGTHTDPYHYKLYWHTDILPDIEMKP